MDGAAKGREADLDPACVAEADEAFLTNVRYGLRPITSVDGRPVATGAISRRLREHIDGLPLGTRGGVLIKHLARVGRARDVAVLDDDLLAEHLSYHD